MRLATDCNSIAEMLDSRIDVTITQQLFSKLNLYIIQDIEIDRRKTRLIDRIYLL